MHVLYYIFYVKDVYSLENRKLLFTSLGKGYVDAIAAHETSVQQYIKDYGAKIRILDEAILTTGIGVAFPKNTDSELPEKLTEVFKEMRKDGSEEKILKNIFPKPVDIWRWIKLKITKLSRRKTQIIVITAGLILFLITIVYSVKTDIKAVARQMDETLKYVKEQCYIYNRYNEASQTKGLMRAIENAQQVNRNLTHTKDEVTKDKLKTYAASIVLEDGSQVDLAAYGRSDEKGIIITFYHTSAEYARNYNLTIQSLLSGYDTYSSGMIVVTDGKNVVASNDEDRIGQSSGGINIIQQVKQKPANKLVRVSDRKCRYIGRMTKGRDYYVYMFIDEQMAFASVFKNLLVVLLLYIFVAASVFAFRRRSKAQLLKIQMMQEEAYKQKLLQEAQRADMANNAKTEFLQRMSHDIRTPINGIRGMIEVADYYKDDSKKQDE